MDGKRPQPFDGPGQVKQSGVVSSALSALHHCRAERFLVALPTSSDLFICAKDLLVEAMAAHAAQFHSDRARDGVSNRL